MSIETIVLLVSALAGSGGIAAIYMLRPQRDSVVVSTLVQAMELLAEQHRRCQEDLTKALDAMVATEMGKK